jgi:hypothetical protein
MNREDTILLALEVDPLETTEYDRRVMVAAYVRARGSVWPGVPESVLERMRAWIDAAGQAISEEWN